MYTNDQMKRSPLVPFQHSYNFPHSNGQQTHEETQIWIKNLQRHIL